MIGFAKQLYKTGLKLGLNISRKLIFGYYPIFLEYPHRPKPRYGYDKPPHQELYDLIDSERDIIRTTLKSFGQFEAHLRKIPLTNPGSPELPNWLNGWLPAFDSIGVYGMLSLNNPKLLIEIGSGNSTKFARQAIRDNKLETRIVSIDPQPRAEINSICDTIIRKPLQDVDISIFDKLDSNDILYIDGSHYSFQNSDVTVIFLEILPKLKSGVIVHFHDIFLPYDYSPEWKERYYNEQYLLATALLINREHFSIILPNAFITEDPELKSILNPIWDNPELQQVERHGGSFWLKIN
ncbi:MAG: class I SAM-dependent methyltransferase [Candidatus Hatepunaea meridiana]|nr:class I SAM-dependent methyltransferase [Candidatus Hatepunaea meridiana]